MERTEFDKGKGYMLFSNIFYALTQKNFFPSIREAFHKVVDKPSESKTTVSPDSYRIRQDIKGVFNIIKFKLF